MPRDAPARNRVTPFGDIEAFPLRGTHRRRLHPADAAGLPDGAFVALDGAPHVILGPAAVEWTRAGYAAVCRRPRGEVTVITPPATVAALRAGYRLRVDPSARAAADGAC